MNSAIEWAFLIVVRLLEDVTVANNRYYKDSGERSKCWELDYSDYDYCSIVC